MEGRDWKGAGKAGEMEKKKGGKRREGGRREGDGGRRLLSRLRGGKRREGGDTSAVSTGRRGDTSPFAHCLRADCIDVSTCHNSNTNSNNNNNLTCRNNTSHDDNNNSNTNSNNNNNHTCRNNTSHDDNNNNSNTNSNKNNNHTCRSNTSHDDNNNNNSNTSYNNTSHNNNKYSTHNNSYNIAKSNASNNDKDSTDNRGRWEEGLMIPLRQPCLRNEGRKGGGSDWGKQEAIGGGKVVCGDDVIFLGLGGDDGVWRFVVMLVMGECAWEEGG